MSVNSCFAMEYYPFLMELIDKFLNKKIDGISYALMLQSITDTVFKNFEATKTVDVIDCNIKAYERLKAGGEGDDRK